MPALVANIADHATAVAAAAQSRRMRVAVAESCTGGLLAAALTAIPGASAWFAGGVVAYNDDIKRNLLGAPPRTLTEHGAVSEQTAAAMRDGIVRLFAVVAAVATTGIAGPGGETSQKPVGMVCFAFHVANVSDCCQTRHFSGDRQAVRAAAAAHALSTLAALMRGEIPSA